MENVFDVWAEKKFLSTRFEYLHFSVLFKKKKNTASIAQFTKRLDYVQSSVFFFRENFRKFHKILLFIAYFL